MNKDIIIIGGGTMQVPLIRQAKKMGFEVWVVDGNPQCPGLSYADKSVIADISDEDQVFDAVKKVASRDIEGVLTVGTDYTRAVSRVGEYCGVPVIPYSLAQVLTDKSLMRRDLVAAGFLQPDFKVVDNQEMFISALNYFSQKSKFVIIKPVDSMGARGVKRLCLEGIEEKSSDSNYTELLADFDSTMQFSRKKKVIVEDVISGKEYSLDAIAYSGEIRVTGIADRIIELPPYFIETGHVIPSQASNDMVDKLRDGFTEAIRAITKTLDLTGAFKGDVFINENREVVVGEIAGRLSGGYMSGYTYPLSSGVNLMEAVISLSIGKNPFPIEEEWLGVVIERAIISHPGVVTAVNNEKEVRSCPGVEEVFVHVKKGDRVLPPVNNLMKSANVIVRGEDYRQAESYMTQALQVLQVVIG